MTGPTASPPATAPRWFKWALGTLVVAALLAVASRDALRARWHAYQVGQAAQRGDVPAVRAQLIELSRYGDAAVEPCAALARHDDAAIRRLARLALVELGSDAAQMALLDLVHTGPAAARRETLPLLTFDQPAAAQALAGIATSEQSPLDERILACDALARGASGSHRDLFFRLILNPELPAPLVAACAMALGQHFRESGSQPFLDLMAELGEKRGAETFTAWLPAELQALEILGALGPTRSETAALAPLTTQPAPTRTLASITLTAADLLRKPAGSQPASASAPAQP